MVFNTRFFLKQKKSLNIMGRKVTQHNSCIRRLRFIFGQSCETERENFHFSGWVQWGTLFLSTFLPLLFFWESFSWAIIIFNFQKKSMNKIFNNWLICEQFKNCRLLSLTFDCVLKKSIIPRGKIFGLPKQSNWLNITMHNNAKSFDMLKSQKDLLP